MTLVYIKAKTMLEVVTIFLPTKFFYNMWIICGLINTCSWTTRWTKREMLSHFPDTITVLYWSTEKLGMMRETPVFFSISLLFSPFSPNRPPHWSLVKRTFNDMVWGTVFFIPLFLFRSCNNNKRSWFVMQDFNKRSPTQPDRNAPFFRRSFSDRNPEKDSKNPD